MIMRKSLRGLRSLKRPDNLLRTQALSVIRLSRIMILNGSTSITQLPLSDGVRRMESSFGFAEIHMDLTGERMDISE
jgi:hypothetical protein